MKYWVIVSKRHKKLWKPTHKDDFYDHIYFTKEGAQSVCEDNYMPIAVKMEIEKEVNKMLTEQAVIDLIERIIEDNKELLNRDLTTVAEDPQTRVERAIVILRLSDLYEVLEEKRPVFKCEKTRRINYD